MGSGNGDGWPDGGPPELPPDWGPVVVPDDPAELAAEAALVRRELRRQARSARWRRRLGADPDGPATLRVPLLFLVVAILATLTSLFAVIRATPVRQQGPRSTTSGPSAGTTNPAGATGAAGTGQGRALPALDLAADTGDLVSLRSVLPAVIILIDGCECPDQVTAAAGAAPPRLAVVILATRLPSPARPPASPSRIRTLADPTGELRGFLQVPARPGTPTVVLADRFARIVRVVPAARSIEDYRADLPQLVAG